MKSTTLFIVLLWHCTSAYSQSAKTIRTYGIEKKTETVIIYLEGKEVSRYLEEVEIYNEEGEWAEKITYSAGGSPKLHEKRLYKDDEIVDETIIDLNGSGIKEARPPGFDRTLYTYKKGDIMAEQKVDEKGATIWKKSYSYNKLGDLIEVVETGSNDELLTRETIDYDERGLKSKEQLIGASGSLLEEKIFTYE